MEHSVAPRDWRRRRSTSHTRETRVEIPDNLVSVMKSMVARMQALDAGFQELAAQVSAANLRAIDMENRLAQVEAVHRVLAEEARKRVA